MRVVASIALNENTFTEQFVGIRVRIPKPGGASDMHPQKPPELQLVCANRFYISYVD